MTNYDNGAAFERKVADQLTLDGYLVFRSAGSRKKADLIALKPGQTLLVQCKTPGPGDVGPGEWNALYNQAEYVNALAVVASRPKRGVVAYHLMTGPKSGIRGVRPPCEEWTPDELTPYITPTEHSRNETAMNHYRHCPASRDEIAIDGSGACRCVEIEAELRAEWLDAGAPDEWDVSA